MVCHSCGFVRSNRIPFRNLALGASIWCAAHPGIHADSTVVKAACGAWWEQTDFHFAKHCFLVRFKVNAGCSEWRFVPFKSRFCFSSVDSVERGLLY